MCVDESGFELLPARVRTWARRGETPLLHVPYLHVPYLHEHLTVISGITPDGRLFQQVLDHGVRGPDCVVFLWHLLRHIEGALTVVWDGLPSHRGEVMRQFLGTKHGHRVRLEQFPSYAPDLNPQEGIWKHLKRVELGNVCCATLEELRQALRGAVERLRHKRHVIVGCFKQCGFV